MYTHNTKTIILPILTLLILSCFKKIPFEDIKSYKDEKQSPKQIT